MFLRPCVQVQFADYGSERIVDVDRMLVLSPQFCSLNRQGVLCQLVGLPGTVVDRPTLEHLMLNRLVVVQVVSTVDEDTCQVMLPRCAHNLQMIPQLAGSASPFTLY